MPPLLVTLEFVMIRAVFFFALALAASLSMVSSLLAQEPSSPQPQHGVRAESLLIRNVRIIPGPGTPSFGPTDILLRGNLIERITNFGPRANADTVIDGTGKTVMPGLINLHGHVQEGRGSMPMPLEYQMSLWLCSGVTTIRDLGSNFEKTLKYREQSAKGTLVAPRIYVYPFVSKRRDAKDTEEFIESLVERGADGLKLYSLPVDLLEVAVARADHHGLPTTTHMGVETATAWDVARLKMTSIEHWYGVPDAAFHGVQNFPAEFSYSNEVDRFRYAGRIWREADPDKLDAVLDAMVEAGVAWDPTFAIYEASRDIVRAQNKPWFDEWMHPALEAFFSPNLNSHGSYFIGWTNADEVYWKENYRIWMDAVVAFARKGGIVTTGEDAGFIYLMYGFGLLRELELHEEAGFHPLEVIQHATYNGALVLGEGRRLGQIREGYLADLLVVDGNPLGNFRLLYPTGTDHYEDGEAVHGGGIDWTIKDGIPYHGPTLRARVKEIVKSDRQAAREAKNSRGAVEAPDDGGQ